MWGSGFRGSGSRFRIHDSGLRVEILRCRAGFQGLEDRDEGQGLREFGFWCKVQV